MDIIILALPRWDGPYSSTAFSFAKEFSKKNRVFYIDNPFTFKDFFLGLFTPQIYTRFWALLFGIKRSKELPSFPQIISFCPPLCMPVNFLPEGKCYNVLSRINNDFVLESVKKMIQKNQIQEFIFINFFNPFYLQNVKDRLTPKLQIYYTVDDIRYSRYIKKHGPRLENLAIRQADLTFATSHELKSKISQISKNTYYLPNAADTTLFKRNAYSLANTHNRNRATVIYTGHIDNRIDFALFKDVVALNPDKNFLMVGPVSVDRKLFETLQANDNIEFIGRKNLEELPPYLHNADCAIIPFKCNDLTRSIYPLKVNEYLAAGIPVVSTGFSEDIREFSTLVKISNEPKEFSEMIQGEIDLDSEEKFNERVLRANENTWEARIISFWKITETYL